MGKLPDNILMLFTDEASQHSYHKAPLLLQVVCQVAETHAASYGVQLELVDCDRSAGMWIAAMAVSEPLPRAALQEIAAKVNHTFARHDEIDTCGVESVEVGLLSVRISESTDYSCLT